MTSPLIIHVLVHFLQAKFSFLRIFRDDDNEEDTDDTAFLKEYSSRDDNEV